MFLDGLLNNNIIFLGVVRALALTTSTHTRAVCLLARVCRSIMEMCKKYFAHHIKPDEFIPPCLLSAGIQHTNVIIDFDVGLRNLDLVMNCERRVVYDLINVVNNEATLSQALIKDKRTDGLYILPASQTRDKDALTIEGVERVLNELSAAFDIIVCDSPAGIEKGALTAMYFADEAIIITNPEVSSVRDSDRILGILQSKTRRAEQGKDPIKEHLLITRYSPERVKKGEMLSIEDIEEILAVPLLGVIPESKSVLKASNQGVPVILDPTSIAGQAYGDAVDRFLGQQVEHRFIQPSRMAIFKRMFGGE